METIKIIFSRLPSILGMLLGATVGWLLHPLVWLPVSLFGPFRLWGLLVAVAAQESYFNVKAEGDIGNPNGSSVGILQFNESRWPSLTGGVSLEKRTSCVISGYYAVVYIQDALLSDWSWWWQLRAPVICCQAIRWLWTHGPADAPELGESWAAMRAEGRSWPAYLISVPIFGALSLLAIAGLSALTWKKGKLKVEV